MVQYLATKKLVVAKLSLIVGNLALQRHGPVEKSTALLQHQRARASKSSRGEGHIVVKVMAPGLCLVNRSYQLTDLLGALTRLSNTNPQTVPNLLALAGASKNVQDFDTQGIDARSINVKTTLGSLEGLVPVAH